MANEQQITVKNIETGVTRTAGKNFLSKQPKPYQSAAGKFYPDGLYVLAGSPSKEKSEKAKKIIEKAASPNVEADAKGSSDKLDA